MDERKDKPTLKASGLKWRQRADQWVPYWIPSSDAVKAGYPVKSVNLTGLDSAGIIQRCGILAAEVREWMGGDSRSGKLDGTLATLIARYQVDADSPYRSLRRTSLPDYNKSLTILERSVGKRRLESLSGEDFRRWHREFSAPTGEGKLPRLRRAQGAMKLLRIVLSYGATLSHRQVADHCLRLSGVLSKMTFPAPARRTQTLTYDHAVAIIAAAHRHPAPAARGIAIGQAIQFDCALRPVDIRSITWEMIDADWTLRIRRTSKTGAFVEFDMREHPLAFAELTRVPPEGRKGLIVHIGNGEPFTENWYSHLWRKIANSAGIPKDVWNRDSRAGAITEALDAGADLNDVRQFATHDQAATTVGYDRASAVKTQRVARLRSAIRGQ